MSGAIPQHQLHIGSVTKMTLARDMYRYHAMKVTRAVSRGKRPEYRGSSVRCNRVAAVLQTETATSDFNRPPTRWRPDRKDGGRASACE
jgi:hypothetical protein